MTSLSKWLPVLLALAVVSAAACGDDDAPNASSSVDGGVITDGGATDGHAAWATQLSRPSKGSALDIAEDDTLLVAVNRDVGTLSVFDIVQEGAASPTVTKRAEVQVCEDPWQVVLSPNGNRAFVVCRKDQKLVRVDALRTTAVKGVEVAVGSEPTSLAITPRGGSVWVSNWMDGTMSEVDAEAMTVRSTLDLNAALVKTGSLGAVGARTGLAHPRNISITNNKDEIETDEFVFVGELFAHQTEPLNPDGRNADTSKQGLVYKISLAEPHTVTTIDLPPIADTGIQDMAGNPVSCFPNQTQGVSVQESFAYVLSICESPQGPLADFTGPPKAACTTDATCPGGAVGACVLPGGVAPGVCATNCTTAAECGKNGGVCTANVCNVNVWNAKALQTPAVTIIDVSAN